MCHAGQSVVARGVHAAYTSGDGSRGTGGVGARARRGGARRSTVPDRRASGCRLALRQGVLPTMVAWVREALSLPHLALSAGARPSVVYDSAETSWLLPGPRPGLWGRAPPAGADCQRHAHRSQAAVVPRRGAGPPGQGGRGWLSVLGRPPAALLGPAHPPGQRPGSEWGSGPGALGRAGSCRAATAGAYGLRRGPQGARGGPGMDLQAASDPAHSAGGHSRDVCPALRAGRRVAGGVAGRPRYRSDASHGGGRPPLWRRGAQMPPRPRERAGHPRGRTGMVRASDLAPPRASDVARAGRSGVRPMPRQEARAELHHAARIPISALYPVLRYDE